MDRTKQITRKSTNEKALMKQLDTKSARNSASRTGFPRGRYPGKVLMGNRVPVDILIPEEQEGARTIAVGICWTKIQHAETPQEVGAWFASLLGVYQPELLTPMIEPLQQAGARITNISVPTESTKMGYEFNVEDSYDCTEHNIFFGMSLMLPFKNITELNYNSLVKARVRALGGSLGLDEPELSRLRYPLDFKRAKMVKQNFGRNKKVKQEILNFLMWAASEQDCDHHDMARHVSMMLAWNELNLIRCISDVLGYSKLPVLEHPRIKDEVDKYQKALDHINKSPCPQYFRYFCTRAEEQLLQRRNFPTLAAVALELQNKMYVNKSNANFAGTTASGSKLTQELVELHERYCKENVADETFESFRILFGNDDQVELLDVEEGEVLMSK